MKIGHHVNTWSGFFKREGLSFDLPRMLREVNQAGYDAVELLADPQQTGPAEQVRALLESSRLALPALATGVTLNPHPPSTESFKTACRYAEALGVQTLMVCGGFNAGKRRHAFAWEYEMFAANLDAHARIATEHGCRISFHPHLKSIVETGEELDRLLEHDPDVDVCLDTGHLIAAGTDPLALLRQYGSRVTHVHLKDWDRHQESFTEIGQGNAGLDFSAFFAELQLQNYLGWVIVERDGPELTALESARLSRRGIEAALSESIAC